MPQLIEHGPPRCQVETSSITMYIKNNGKCGYDAHLLLFLIGIYNYNLFITNLLITTYIYVNRNTNYAVYLPGLFWERYNNTAPLLELTDVKY